MKVRNSKGELKELVIKANDSIPANGIIEFDGDVVPEGYEKAEDEDWENLNEVKMEKTELGFQAEIFLGEGDSFNFCFRNGNDEWDNNDGQNYTFNLEKKQAELIVLEDEPVSLGSARKLRKSYLWSKKIRLAVYKIITYFPKILSGNYKRKVHEA